MSGVSFLTGNRIKFAIASRVFAEYGLTLEQETLDVPSHNLARHIRNRC